MMMTIPSIDTMSLQGADDLTAMPLSETATSVLENSAAFQDAVARFQSSMGEMSQPKMSEEMVLMAGTMPVSTPVVESPPTPVVASTPTPVVESTIAPTPVGREAPIAPVVESTPAPTSVGRDAPIAPQVAVTTPIVESTPAPTPVGRDAPIAPQVAVTTPIVEAPIAPIVESTPAPTSVGRDVPIAPQLAETAPIAVSTPTPVVEAPTEPTSVGRDAPIAPQEAGLKVAGKSSLKTTDEKTHDSIIVQPFNPLAFEAVQQVVADVKVTATDAATARTQVLVDAVEAVCDTILVTPGLLRGQGEVRIQLKPEVLSGTEIRIEAKGATITVAFHPTTQDAAMVLQQNIAQFEQHLAGRIHNYQIAAKVNVDEKKLKG